MPWFCMQGSKRVGPFEGTEWDSLVANGTVTAETWVWREGMPKWRPYAEVSTESATTPTFQVICSHCGEMLSSDEMERHGSARVCAPCRSSGAGQAKKTVPHSRTLPMADLSVRAGAFFLDGIVFWIANMVFCRLTGVGTHRGTDYHEVIYCAALDIAFIVLYETLMMGGFGATLGKMAFRLKVVRADGSPVGFIVAIFRTCGKMVSALILYLGFVLAGFDEERRTLHDMLCNTRVVRRA